MEPVQNSIEQHPNSRANLSSKGRAANPKAYGRNRISNGSGSALPTRDGRSLWARIRRDTINAIVNGHLAGADQASETQLLMARRVGTLEAELIHLEDKFARTRAEGGEPEPALLDLYGRLADRQRRLADPLGWERRAKNVEPPSLDAYLAMKQQQRARVAQQPKIIDAIDNEGDVNGAPDEVCT